MSASPLTTTADIDSTDYVRGINRIREIMPDSPRLEAVELYVGALLEQIDALRSALTASEKRVQELEQVRDKFRDREPGKHMDLKGNPL